MKTWHTKSGYSIYCILSGRSNVFLLTDGSRNILIDTSSGRMWNLLLKRLESLRICNIDFLILTHTHYDHTGNAKRIKQKFGTRVIVHKEEASFLTNGISCLPEGTNFFSSLVIGFPGRLFMPVLRSDPCEYDILAEERFDLRHLGFNAYIIHTPGHSAGSMSLIVDDEIALVGDTMFGIFRWSVFPPFANDISLMIESWGKLLNTGCSTFIPSHGTANSRGLVLKDYEKRRNIQNINLK